MDYQRPDNLMDVDIDSTGRIRQRYTFENLEDIPWDDLTYSTPFFICNAAFSICIEKVEKDNGTPYLSIYLCKLYDRYEMTFSYEIKLALTLLNTDMNKNLVWRLSGKSSNSRFKMGMRSGEDTILGAEHFIAWNRLLNPNQGFVDLDDDDIQVEVELEIVNIEEHKESCLCSACT